MWRSHIDLRNDLKTNFSYISEATNALEISRGAAWQRVLLQFLQSCGNASNTLCLKTFLIHIWMSFAYMEHFLNLCSDRTSVKLIELLFFLLKALVLGAPSSLILRRCTKAPSLRTLRRCFCASIFSPQSLRCVRCVSSFCAFLFHHVLSVIDLKLLKPFSKHIEQNDNDMITKWSLECWLFDCFKFSHTNANRFEETLWFDAGFSLWSL